VGEMMLLSGERQLASDEAEVWVVSRMKRKAKKERTVNVF